MNTRKLLVSLFVGLVSLTSAAFAQTEAAAATVARFSGNVTAVLPDGSMVTVTQGMQLPQGTTITTGDKSDAYLVTHGDTTSVVTANSEVTVAESSVTSTGGQVTQQTTTLDLKSGNLVAKLNPAKKSVNNYSVRTPKGVAAARGTVFTVTYKGTSYSIAVINGNVSITPSAGLNAGITHVMGAGQVTGTMNGQDLGASATVAELQASDPVMAAQFKEILAVAVATVAVAAENNIGGTTAAEVRAVADAVIKADPGAAPAIAALVAASAPTQSRAIIDSTAANAPAQSTAVQEAVRTSTPTTTTNPTTGEKTTTPTTTAPTPIDPGTVSRSG